ncbi:hypothetical protein DdX_17034 [Ditylenchus destructor]|uniref:Transmembrane protein n=1 Tax=Ditylenchus destructor TaxID=166010 RepID=A0AAD4MS41_9BILA|nr:hypothetical protein DdX_17034 [Ditylenchus destructor]
MLMASEKSAQVLSSISEQSSEELDVMEQEDVKGAQTISLLSSESTESAEELSSNSFGDRLAQFAGLVSILLLIGIIGLTVYVDDFFNSPTFDDFILSSQFSLSAVFLAVIMTGCTLHCYNGCYFQFLATLTLLLATFYSFVQRPLKGSQNRLLVGDGSLCNRRSQSIDRILQKTGNLMVQEDVKGAQTISLLSSESTESAEELSSNSFGDRLAQFAGLVSILLLIGIIGLTVYVDDFFAVKTFHDFILSSQFLLSAIFLAIIMTGCTLHCYKGCYFQLLATLILLTVWLMVSFVKHATWLIGGLPMIILFIFIGTYSVFNRFDKSTQIDSDCNTFRQLLTNKNGSTYA